MKHKETVGKRKKELDFQDQSESEFKQEQKHPNMSVTNVCEQPQAGKIASVN